MAYIIWVVLLSLVVWAYYDPNFPKWIPPLAYLVVVTVRVKGKIENYKDWKTINKRDEKIKLEETADAFARRGLTFSGMRNNAEAKIGEDFEYERKRKKREFENDLVNSLFLK